MANDRVVVKVVTHRAGHGQNFFCHPQISLKLTLFDTEFYPFFIIT